LAQGFEGTDACRWNLDSALRPARGAEVRKAVWVAAAASGVHSAE
jgi:hypothetical protein